MARTKNPEEEKELVKIRDTINQYGKEKYGISNNMIGWDQRKGGGGTVQINGSNLMDVAADRIDDGRSYAPEDDIKYAIDQYANKNKLSPLNVSDEVEGSDDVTGPVETGFEDPYADRIDQYLSEILNREKFDYDVDDDESYQALEEQYEVKGDRAMEDVMGAASQMTGGRTNSWSETVAAQAKNRANEGLLGKIPALEQAAYQRYMNEANQDAQALNMLMGASDQQYSRFADNRNFERGVLESDRNFNRSVLESDRNFNFQSEEAEKAAERWQAEFDYNVSRDQIADERWLKQFDYQKQQDAIANAYKNRQISLSEANLALRKAQEANSQFDSQVGDYLSYAAQQLEAGKSEYDVKEHIYNLKESGDINEATYRQIMNRFPAKEIVDHGPDNKLSVAWQAMMESGDPKTWLTENAPQFNDEEIQILEKYIPNKDGNTFKIVPNN